MDGSVRSGGVLKKKSSSGCLIIKKKDESKNSGEFGGFSNRQQKKRPRLTVSYSSSSDEDESLEFLRRKVIDRRINNSSAGYEKRGLEGRKFDRNDGGMTVSGEKKRNSLDLFEFDEYDEFDGEKMKNNYLEDRLKIVGQGKSKKFGVGTSNRNLVADKREKGLYFERSSGGRSEGVEGDVRDEGDDETKMPISFLKLKHEGRTADEPIRLQGKNGVLKVMVNKKKKMDIPHKNDDHREIEHENRSISENDFKEEAAARLRFYSDSKSSENQGLPIDEEGNNNKGKKEAKLKKGKPFLTKDSKVTGSAINGTDTMPKLATPDSQACSSKERRTKKAEDRFPTSVSIIPAKGKERKGEKSKQSGSTEKQMLREKIRKMLIDAGWTIDYRPRRNRDYLDAVYINPGGTAYWSIIKAYDAFLKQLEEDDGKNKLDVGSASFAPLSEDLLNKLTRQTKKKIKEESERKRKVDQESEDYLSDESHKRKPRKVRIEKSTVTLGSNIIQGRTSKVIGRCTLLARGSDKGENSYSDGFVSYHGKRTILSWLVDSGTAKLSEKVQYKNRKRNRVMLEGWITRDGIHCGCCSKILPVSKFELHAGSKLRQPFQNIYLESGDSLLQSQIDAWNRQEESMRRDIHYVDVDGGDPDDDTCGICGDGGDLICCDSCPSTFHQICLDIKMLPSGDWHCPNCTCRYCWDTNAPGSGNTAADKPIKCICCEKKYHKSCSERVFAAPSIANSASICGQKCQELYDHLQKILGVKHELEAGFSWSLVQRTDVSDTSHRNFPQRVECNSKLAVALSVMNECFLPIFDRRSGINLMNSVIYNCGSNFNRLNYSGFYTAILERGDEVISASSIRIHGTRLAEMPFIGTREIYRRQGMCRRLLFAIETALTSMGVEKLIIPAISEHMNTWTTVFSFHQLDDVLKKEIKSMNMLVFPGTDMLQKQLIMQEYCEVFESEKNQLQPSDLENSVVDLSMEHSNRVENNVGVCPVAKIDENVGALDSDSPGSPVTKIDENVGILNSDSQAMAFPSNDAAAASASDDALCESDVRLASKGTTVTMSKETDQRKETSGLKCPPTPGESDNSSGTESPLPHPASNDKTNSSMETTVRNACKSNPDASRVESIRDSTDESTENQNPVTSEGAGVGKVQVTVDSAVKDSEDAAPDVEATDGCAKSALETFAKSTTDKPIGASFTMTVVSEEPLVSFNPNNELAVPVTCTEPSYDSTAATNDRISIAGVTVGASAVSDANGDANGDKTSCLSTSCIMEVRCEQIDSVEESNENPILNSTSLENVENTLKFSSDCDNEVVLDEKRSSVSVIVLKEVAASAESDKLNGEIEIHRAVDEKVITTKTSHEDSRDTSTTENQPNPSTY